MKRLLRWLRILDSECWLVTYELTYKGKTSIENVAYEGSVADWMMEYVYSAYRMIPPNREEVKATLNPKSRMLNAVRISSRDCYRINHWGSEINLT